MCSSDLGSVSVFDEQRHRRGKSVQRVAARDRADLPGGEEAGERTPANQSPNMLIVSLSQPPLLCFRLALTVASQGVKGHT